METLSLPLDPAEELHEECGIFGIVKAPSNLADAAQDSREPVYDTYNALYTLQHRGQDSCGIAACIDGSIRLHKDQGLVPEVFSQKDLDRLVGASAAIGHVRHANNTADVNPLNAQPIVVHRTIGSMALCYNGKLVNSMQLRIEMESRGAIFQTTNDAEIITYLIVREHLRTNTLEDAVINAMEYMIGAYSVVVMSQDEMVAFRDPNGFRPLCLGRVGDSYVFASESAAIDALGGELIRDVHPGELISIRNGSLTSQFCRVKAAKSALCMFELIYFARQDSVIDGTTIGDVREEAGRYLARNSTVDGDLVIGVPDSGLAAALGYARESGIPYGIGLVKNRYIARTFIQSSTWERRNALRIKLNANSSVVKGKRVILVDDSIVRGKTSARIVQLLRDAGATEVHMKVTAPPFRHPCYYGTAIPSGEQLAAYDRTEEEVCRLIGADSLQYMPLEGLRHLSEKLNLNYCDACFTGNYILPVPHLHFQEGQKL